VAFREFTSSQFPCPLVLPNKPHYGKGAFLEKVQELENKKVKYITTNTYCSLSF
jgi:hypothetical protein